MMKRAFLGEMVGTFLLVFFGCGAVAGAVTFNAFDGLFQVAAIWGLGVAGAIALTGPLSGAHLNPAITLTFALVEGFPKKKIPLYFAGQFAGAFLAAGALYLLFGSSIAAFEKSEGLVRGAPGSEASARIFGEFHPGHVSMATAFFAEFLGTALLAFFIFGLIDKRRLHPLPEWAIPIAIGMTLMILISIFAPLSMAGFNPARDFAPRLFSSLVGWKMLPFEANGMSWLVVYLLGPFMGGPVGGWLAKRLF